MGEVIIHSVREYIADMDGASFPNYSKDDTEKYFMACLQASIC